MASVAKTPIQVVIYAWIHGQWLQRSLIVFAIVAVFAGFALVGLVSSLNLSPIYVGASSILVVAGVLILKGIQAYWEGIEAGEKADQVHALEEQVRENPKEAKLAWDLARIKLESYLDRNLKQVSSIFLLILLVMLFGMALISIGVWQAVRAPQTLAAPVLAALAGIIVQFIGGTFLLVYRSTMEQAKNYVVVLERINAVGMSINILESIESGGAQIRDAARAELARDLLGMYGTPPPDAPAPQRRSAGRPRTGGGAGLQTKD